MEAIYLVIFSLLTLTSKPTFSLSLRRLPTNPTFVSDVAIFGDAEIINGGSSVQLTRPIASSSGLLIYTKPIKPTSFSTDFSFSISPHSGDGLALVIVPSDFPRNFPGKSSFGVSPEFKFLGIEFDTSMDADVGDENANHVGVDVGSLVSARVFNVSSLNLVLNSGMKLRSWVDYDASSKRLEVRLGEMGNPRPFDPLMGFPIDLSEMWRGEDVLVGISSSSGNSAQTSSVYSWDFRVRSVPSWMHSQPADPRRFSDKGREKRVDHKKDPCPLSLVSGLIVGIGCGALVALMVLFLWAIFVNRHVVIPVGYSWKPADFGYKKVSVDVENSSVNVKN
ncbi:L-type lectin-domain containing receptor kinase VIII.1-like [Actinidia eriantha]|uniref:L-type lectin-domain containing receptor kinase VIII.1-like n=1 Tax=Actinidia eriantha TaxID=165200 RepID=UPI002583BCC0|nr:L-type lectin-domain containing receptor kinase VIII.1-like [Actinidia eriantha]